MKIILLYTVFIMPMFLTKSSSIDFKSEQLKSGRVRNAYKEKKDSVKALLIENGISL